MNKRIMFGVVAVVCLMSMGCSHSVVPVNGPTNNTTDDSSAKNEKTPENPTPGINNTGKKDGFDKAGDAAAIGSRWVYDESLHAYHYLTSDEMKQRYGQAWDATKEAAVKVYDSIHDAYEAWKRDNEKQNEEKK